MTWKTDLLDSPLMFDDFICRHAETIIGTKCTLTDGRHQAHDCVDKELKTAEGEQVLCFYFENNVLSIVHVEEKFQRKGLGFMVFKAFIGRSPDYPNFKVYVDGDGTSVWPKIGLVSIYTPELDQKAIISRINNDDVPQNDKEKLQALWDLSTENPYLAYFQYYTKLAPTFTSKAACLHPSNFGIYYEDEEMVLIPSLPIVRDQMEKRLGRLPPFRPPEKPHPYKHIISALSMGRRQIEKFPALII